MNEDMKSHLGETPTYQMKEDSGVIQNDMRKIGMVLISVTEEMYSIIFPFFFYA